MNAELRSVKTSAEQTLADAYQASKAKLPGGRKVVALREAAAARAGITDPIACRPLKKRIDTGGSGH